MDFAEICSFFGGSILFDDYTTDLDDAEAQVGNFERNLNVSTEEDRVALSLRRGLLSAAKGEFASSETSFTSALSIARSTRDARLISRCETYIFLLSAIKAELPLSRFHDDTDGNWRRLSDAQTGDFERRVRFIEDGSAVRPSLTELDRLERDVVSKFAQYPSNIRTFAFPHHPAYHRHDYDILFRSGVPFPSPIPGEAERLGLRAISRHMRRLNAEYLLAGASEQGTQELEQLYQEYLHDGDLVGAASCQLILGDNRLSLPFTSPIALNLSLMNRTSARLQPWHDNIETGHRLAYNSEADQFYERAIGLFRAAPSVRGTAAVHFRQGCVALAEYLNALFLQTALPTPGMQGRLDAWRASAKSQLDDALDLHHGDGAIVRLISAHSIILRILVSCPPGTSQHPAADAHDAVQDASKIGIWAKDKANTGVARFAGLLFLGVGRLLSTAPRNLDAASLCCACARSCFRAAEERILELHAIIQHAELLRSHGNMEAARAHLDDGQSVLRYVVVNHIDPLIQTAATGDCRVTVKAIRATIITELDSAAASIYANNPRSHAWETLRSELLSERRGLSSTATPPSQTSPPSTLNALLSSFVEMYVNFTNTSAAGITSLGTGHGMGATTGVGVAKPTRTQAAQRTAGAAPDEANEQPTMTSMLGQLGDSDAIRRIRQQFDEAIAERRKALVVDNDWEEGQERLRGILHALDQPGVPKSIELYSVRAAVLHYLERHDLIRQWLPDAIPVIFGGRLPIASDHLRQLFLDASPELQNTNRQIILQHGERSISLCFVAQHWEMGATVLQRIQEYDPGFLDWLHTDKGDESWVNMVYVAAIEEHSGKLESSFQWLIKALDIIETSRSRLTDVADRRELLNVIQSTELFAGLARVSLRLSASQVPARRFERLLTQHWTFRGPTWADKALNFLEQGRARALLDLFIPEGQGPPQDYLEWLQKLRKEECDMRNGKTTSTYAGGEDHDSDMAAYLARLRSGLRREMESPSRTMIIDRLHRPHFAADTRRLYESIPEDALAIHMNPSGDAVLVLYISRNGIELARPSSFTDQRMERHVLQYLKLFKEVDMDKLPSKVKCQALLEELSDDILRPALQLIDGKSHLIFVPSQSLNKFPFSALLLHGEPLFLRKDVSMVPSLSVLQHLVQTARHGPNRTQDGTCSRTPLRATVVYRAPIGRSAHLSCSAAAAIETAGRLGCRPEQAHQLGLEAFKDAYKTSDLVAICTHGLWRLPKMKRPDNKEPEGQKSSKALPSAWESSIQLKAKLQVLELVPLRSRAALVVFQACVSGVGESSLGNDVLGFAHSVLASGAGAFVGALWNVSDVASAMLMSFLFRELTAAAAGADSSLATYLRRAQIRLYQTDATTAKSVLENFRDACAALEPAHISQGHKRKILNALNGVAPGEYDFSHPFFWAPFVLVGHGGRRLEDLAPRQPHSPQSHIMSQNLDPFSLQSSQEPEEALPPLPPRPPPLPPRPPPLPSRPRLQRRPVPAPSAAAVSHLAASPPQGPQTGELGAHPPSSLPSFAKYTNPNTPGRSSSSLRPAPTYNFNPCPDPGYLGLAAPCAMPVAHTAAVSPQAAPPQCQQPQPEKRHSLFGFTVRQLAKDAFLESIMPGLSTILALEGSPVPPNQNQPPTPPTQAGTQPPCTPGQVIVNGVTLGQADLLTLQAAVGPVWAGSYWYDSISGAYGTAGGPCIGFLPAAPALGGGRLAPDASGHTGTGVFINGREIHGLDVAALEKMGAVVRPGRWWVRADGSYGAEGSGFVLGNLRMQAAYNSGGGGGGAHSWSTSQGHYGGSDGQGFMYFGGPGWSWSNN